MMTQETSYYCRLPSNIDLYDYEAEDEISQEEKELDEAIDDFINHAKNILKKKEDKKTILKIVPNIN